MHIVLVFVVLMRVMGGATMWCHQVCHLHRHFPGHEMGCWCDLELGSYRGPCKVVGVVKHAECTLHGYHSVMLGMQEASTFQIVYEAFQSHPVDYWMLEGLGR